MVNTSMGSTATIPNDKYLLVSDSNEVSDQFDSKKLQQSELSHLAEENLYKKYLGIKNEEDRLYVTAAAYNAGSGHLQDAMALCTKYEKDSVDSWRNIFKYLSLKSQKEYYNDPVVRCGYYPGNHSIKYAKEVMARYDAYRIQYK